MRKTEIALWLFLGVAVVAATVSVVNITRSPSAVAANSTIYKHLDLFGDVLEKIRADYVENPDDKKLIEAAINGMLSSLDPHSAYLNADHFRDMQVHTKGEFGGLGIEVSMENGLIKVVAPIDDTPAAKAGILSGDLISHLDDEPVLGLTLKEAVDKMRGPINSPIRLMVIRAGQEEPLEVKIVRAKIRINRVRSNVEGNVGYVRLPGFNENTDVELKDALLSLKKKIGSDKIEGYILDLRNNPGGLLDKAVSVSDMFLDQGAIVLTRGRNLEETERRVARKGDVTSGKKVVVLINGGSASAAEIVAGALQDHRRATIIGTRSFGKGSVQTIIPLGANGAIRLTTARYYTPSGNSIQAKGIKPDVKVEQDLPENLKKAQARTRGEASLRGHLKSESGEEVAGSSGYVPREKEKDKQLQYALDLLRGVVKAEKTIEGDTGEKKSIAN
ncbi:MAG: S41 family peptidase [Methyloligellaceae bacterium]